MKKIAVFGGTFNPIHFGHLRVAEESREGLGLDQVLFVPSAIPPHKQDGELAPAEKRLEMVALAIGDNPDFTLSDMEIKRGGRSFTVETLRELKEEGPEDLSISLIVGADSFNDITTWCEYEELFNMAGLIVVARPGYPVKKIGEVLPDAMARRFSYDAATESYRYSSGTSVTYLTTTLMDISSSEIRRMIKGGRSVKYLVPEAVAEYIENAGLYR